MRIIILFCSIFLFACSSKRIKYPVKTDAKVEIIQTMQMQEEAWSDGDLEQYMQGYWKSPKLTFTGKYGITYGWETTLSNYKKSYPNKASMGKLQFDILELQQLAPDTFLVLGKYTLIRKEDNPSGHFTLIWKYIDGQWLIISDHSS